MFVIIYSFQPAKLQNFSHICKFLDIFFAIRAFFCPFCAFLLSENKKIAPFGAILFMKTSACFDQANE